MTNKFTKKNSGFTLVEAMVAVLILTLTVASLMTVVANSLFTARYASDDITASYLMQEAVDYIRNDRDSSIFLQNSTWDEFKHKYDNCLPEVNGCYLDVVNKEGTEPLPAPYFVSTHYLYYDDHAETTPYYVTDTGPDSISGMLKTSFQRKIVVTNMPETPDEMDIAVTVTWLNGGSVKTRTLTSTLTNWQQ
ncbi:MAG: type II secretion system protein [Candidatus Nomurabacteria bacterium]|nr:type II secretion system protein [Candidatus Nomurabacteria bacterium]